MCDRMRDTLPSVDIFRTYKEFYGGTHKEFYSYRSELHNTVLEMKDILEEYINKHTKEVRVNISVEAERIGPPICSHCGQRKPL